MRYGNLVVVDLAEIYVSPQGKRQNRFVCKCDCGDTAIATSRSFSSLKIKLNGCNNCFSKRMSDLNTVHSGTKGGKTRLFNIWKDMRRRCRRPNRDKNYASRGISVCDEWNDFSIFREWAYVNGYNDNLTIERSNVNGNYEPSNCKWIPKAEQARNKTNTRLIDFIGKTVTATEAEREIGLSQGVINAFRTHHKITHQEAFDHLLCREINKTLDAEKVLAA